jgi:hypothetical protein
MQCTVSSWKIREQGYTLKNEGLEGKTDPLSGCAPVGWENLRKWWRVVNMVNIFCIYIWKQNEIYKGRMMEDDGGVESKINCTTYVSHIYYNGNPIQLLHANKNCVLNLKT